ncbi:hypothetical protein MSPP1_001640 [Malassezia sp. CBS 17886]|nr:hypothetical protein MSPP1_001640 [Malassezia sp. CBS 17886]
MRIRVCTEQPLPHAQFLVPVDTRDSLGDVRARIAAALTRHYAADSVAPDDIQLSHDGFLLLDEFGTQVLRDGDAVVIQTVSALPARPAKRARTGETPRGHGRRAESDDRDVLADAHRIALLVRSECGSAVEAPTGEAPWVPDPAPLASAPRDAASAALTAFAQRKREKQRSGAGGPPGDTDNGGVGRGSDDGTPPPQYSASNDHMAMHRLSRGTPSSPPEVFGIRGRQSTEHVSAYVPPGEGSARTRRKNQRRRERAHAAAGASAFQVDRGDVDTRDAKPPLRQPASALPPGGGAFSFSLADEDADSGADDRRDGDAHGDAPVDGASPRACTKATTDRSAGTLEAIAARMLARTTVGHRKRKAKNAMLALSHIPHAAQGRAADETSVQAPPAARRVPPPSMRTPDEIPEGFVVSSTDCAAWYAQQWDEECVGAGEHSYYDGANVSYDDPSGEQGHDARTAAYLETQRQVRCQLADEKAREDSDTAMSAVTPAAQSSLSRAGSPRGDAHAADRLRAALPASFGRGGESARLGAWTGVQDGDADEEVSEQQCHASGGQHAALDYGDPHAALDYGEPHAALDYGAPAHAARTGSSADAASPLSTASPPASVLHRFRVIRDSVFRRTAS